MKVGEFDSIETGPDPSQLHSYYFEVMRRNGQALVSAFGGSSPEARAAESMPEMVLDVSGLTVRRENVTAVENVSFSLLSETDTALVGILPASAGTIRVLGHPMGPPGQLPPLRG